MAILNQDKSVHSTTKTLINTVGKVRELVNTLLHYNPATTPLTETQIRWLLNSPLESIIKNILFFEMAYAAVKESSKKDLIHKLLEKVGLKELALRYREWLIKREEAQSKSAPIPELMLEFEKFRVISAPVAPTKQKLSELNLRLNDLSSALRLIVDEIKILFVKHQQLIQNLVLLNSSHVNTVNLLARESNLQIQEEHIITLLPEVHNTYHMALTPHDQIRALGRLLDADIASINSITSLNQFLNRTALRTAMTAYEDTLGMLSIEFNLLSEQMIACQMRENNLLSQIQNVEMQINEAQSAESTRTTPRPQFDEAPSFSPNDIQQMLSSFRIHEDQIKRVSEESQELAEYGRAAPAA